MANFTLSTQRLSGRGQSRGLQAAELSTSGIAGSLRQASSINPNSGQIGYTAANQPQSVHDVTGDAAVQFMGVAANAAFQFEEREGTYLANQATIAFREKARKAYYGYEDSQGNFVPGYQQSSKGDAVAGFQQFKESMKKDMTDLVSGLEPRVQQKALVGLYSTSNTYLGKAATHRGTQMGLAREEQNAQDVRELTMEMVLNPEGIDVADPNTGATYKSKFLNMFTDLEKGYTAWTDTMGDLVKLSYQNSYREGINSGMSDDQASSRAATMARDYYAGYVSAELAAEPGKAEKIQSQLKTWDLASKSASAQAESAKIRRDEANIKRTQAQTEATLYADARGGKIASTSEVNELVRAGSLTVDAAKQHNNDHNSIEVNTTNPIVMAEITKSLRDIANAGGSMLEASQAADRAGVKSAAEKDGLMRSFEQMVNPRLSPRFNGIFKAVEEMSSVRDFRQRLDPEKSSQLGLTISGIIESGLRDGLSDSQTIRNVTSRLDQETNFKKEDLVAYPGGERPATQEQNMAFLAPYFTAYTAAESTFGKGSPEHVKAANILADASERYREYEQALLYEAERAETLKQYESGNR